MPNVVARSLLDSYDFECNIDAIDPDGACPPYDRFGVKDARIATMEQNEIDSMPFGTRSVRTPRPASPRGAAPPVHPSAPCRRPPACFATSACAAIPAR